MGLSTKQVSGDQTVDWGQTLIHPGGLDLSKPPPLRRQQQQQQQQQPEPLPCPRCSSTNTKFCYYNNYNKSQPRHFCKACKRHWTRGGTLRNVPVGGARKHKRLKTSSNTNTNTSTSNTAAKSLTVVPDVGTYHPLMRAPSSSSLQLQDGNINCFTRKNLMNNGVCMMGSSGLSFPNFPTLSSNIETNPSSICNSFQSSNSYNFVGGGLKSMEDSTITTIIPTTTTTSSGNNVISHPWHGQMEMPNYWNWDDIDTMVSTDLNLQWDDTTDHHIKP